MHALSSFVQTFLLKYAPDFEFKCENLVMEIHCLISLFYQGIGLVHSFVLETNLNQHW